MLLIIYIYIKDISVCFIRVSTNSPKPWVQKIKDKLQFDYYYKYYFLRFQKSNQYLMDKLDFMDTILNFLLKLILKHYLILRILYFGLIYGPRYLLAIIFFIESIFFGRLNFFYSFLPLLFVPLLCQYILFTLKDFTETSLENLNNCLDVTVLTETQQYKANVLVYQDYILSLDPRMSIKLL